MKKYIKILIILIILIILYLYTANITLMPKSITLLEGEKLRLATLWGVSLKENVTTNPNIISIDENIDGVLETSGEV